MFGFHQRKRISAVKYQQDMNKLWKENSEMVVQLINHAIVEDETARQWGARLANNQQSIANGIIYFYGEKEKISRLFNQFIQYIGEAIDVFIWNKDAVKLRIRWCKKADELSDSLHELSSWTVRSYFYGQMSLIEALIKGFKNKDMEAVKHYHQQLLNNNIDLSAEFYKGVIADNRKSFI